MSTRRTFLVLCLAFTTSCVRSLERNLVPVERVATLDGRSKFLKVHGNDGRTHVLHDWRVDERRQIILGTGKLLDVNRDVVEEGNFEIPLDAVALFETNVTELGAPVMAMAVITGISVAVTLYCASNPKACFGSCPTFYIAEAGDKRPRAEGFSASLVPALEATDVDALYGLKPSGSRLAIQMRNEALETHVVRHVDILAVPRPPGGRVFASSDGVFWAARGVVEPLVCRAPEGDCLPALRATDGVERFSSADSTDLTRRETLELEFPELPPGRLGLVIGSRQTLLSTYLLYQTFAWMGRSAGRYLAALQRGDAWIHERLRTLESSMGVIEVLVRTHGGDWQLAGDAHETGPLATDVHMVPLPSLGAGPVRVRLRLTRGNWRLDSVGLAQLVEPVEPLRCRPVQVGRGGGVPDHEAHTRLLDAELQLTTLPGDEFMLEYDLPTPTSSYELFLESRGYYLEWMREEWLAEEDRGRVAALLSDPRAALRALAPEFKKVEPLMEEQFWGSRYVR